MVKNKILPIVFGILSLLVLMRYESNWRLSIKFVDEHDNMVIGKYVGQGEKLYQKYFSHHQPIPYIASAIIQKIGKANTTYGLIKQHREAIMLWSGGWWLGLIALFGWAGVVMMWGVEAIKFYFEGHLFLAESLVVYPIIFLLLSYVKGHDYIKNKGWVPISEGVALAFCGWSLAPLWPMLIIWFLARLAGSKKKMRWVWLTGGGFLLASLPLLLVVDIAGYWREAIVVNSQYYSSLASRSGIIKDLILGMATPINVILARGNLPFLNELKIFSVLFLTVLVIMVYEKKYVQAGTLVVLTGLLNSRNVMLGVKYGYDDPFHLWPWVAGIMAISVMYLFLKNIKWKMAVIILVIIAVIIPKREVTQKRDPATEFDIYFSRGFNMSEAIKKIATKDDSLMVIPDETLWYWQSEINPATEFIFFHRWMWEVPAFRKEVVDKFNKSPPSFLSSKDNGTEVEKYLNLYLRFKYRGELSELYILKSKWNSLSEEQKNSFRYYGLSEDESDV